MTKTLKRAALQSALKKYAAPTSPQSWAAAPPQGPKPSLSAPAQGPPTKPEIAPPQSWGAAPPQGPKPPATQSSAPQAWGAAPALTPVTSGAGSAPAAPMTSPQSWGAAPPQGPPQTPPPPTSGASPQAWGAAPPMTPTSQPTGAGAATSSSAQTPAGMPVKLDFDGALKDYQAASTPEAKNKVLQKLTTSMKGSISDADRAGADDVIAGRMDTPAAKAFIDQRLGPAGDEYMKQFVQQEIANKPEATQNPTMFGQIQNMAQNAWQGMGPMGQLAFTFGVPMALIGLLGGGGLTSLLGGLGIGALGLGAAGMGMFGNDARAGVGNMMTNAYEFFSGNELPKDVNTALGPDADAATQLKVRNAMDAKNQAGARGGWAAGQGVIDQQLQQADTLLKMPRDLAITALMGRGAKTPEQAAGMLDQIAAKRQEAAAPGYLQAQARGVVTKRLQEGDKDGWLQTYLAKRNASGPGINWFREGQILDRFKNDPELSMYLTRDANGNLALPAGNNMDEFAGNMLRNAYGDYEKQNSAHKIALRHWTMKAARCWAGYEPVPGKKPYSNDSCRPVGSKKKKDKKAKT